MADMKCDSQTDSNTHRNSLAVLDLLHKRKDAQVIRLAVIVF